MGEDAFNLDGKVAIVTGCDTGLGQGMALGLAQAGCDIVAVNRKRPDETARKVEALGRRFTVVQADLSTVVSRWLVMPMPASCEAAIPAASRA